MNKINEIEHITVFGGRTGAILDNVQIPPETLDKIKAEYPADDGYPSNEQIKQMADEIVYHGGKKLSDLTKVAGTALKFDQDKLDWSLLPWDTLEEIIKVLQFGAGKYSPWNWAEGDGFKYNRLFNSSMRHFIAWFWRREDKDPETGLSHIAHLGCNVLFLLHYILNGNKFKNNDNRPNLPPTN
jgi:hypothetical protein